MKVYDTANQLAKEIQSSEEFVKYKNASKTFTKNITVLE